MYVPTPAQPPESPRVRELSQRIQQVISDFQRQYPMTPGEIRQALLHAAGAAGGQRPRLAVALLAGLVAALGLGVFAAQRSGAGTGASWMSILVLVAVLAGVAAVVLVRRSQ